ncbi:delta-like protein A [Patiria miniata]|uniref:EGF-like domain-containing protein n=1 Tax=Patiria miniata TaxID=46514 RepID=A0A914ALZ3_PATMI|nr:delta-like protein A [Patiria miniata]
METTRFAFCILLVSLVGLTSGLPGTGTACDSHPCMNGGTCSPNGPDPSYGYECYCPEHVIGLNCQDVQHQCDGNPCMNGGTCDATGVTEPYVCRCPPNIEGDRCQYAFCLDDPCLNGGTCYNSAQGFWCMCPFLYQGEHCEQHCDPITGECTA